MAAGVGTACFHRSIDTEKNAAMITQWLDQGMQRLGLRTRLPVLDEPPAPPPDSYRGWLFELSAGHVEGWILNLSRPGARVDYEVVLTDTGEVLARGTADQFRHGSHGLGVGDGAHTFHQHLSRSISEAEQASLVVRPRGGGEPLPRSAELKTSFEPLLHVVMDIVDNCNLRCPFCVYDYANTRTTNFMTEATIDAALRFLPLVRDGEFWFSCLHEPTLHPSLMDFIDKVPRAYRRKLFYTSNLAKRMPARYFDWLSDSGVHHINISIESLRPELYERMRKGARFPIFKQNWDALLEAMTRGTAPPQLRYIVMVYRSNLAEIPELVRYLLEERQASQVELRYTYDVAHLPPEFRRREFLDQEQWFELRDRLAGYPSAQVQLMLPPASAFDNGVPVEPDHAPAEPAGEPSTAAPGPILADYYMLRLSWDGSLTVIGTRVESRNDQALEVPVLEANVRDIDGPADLLERIARLAGPAGTAAPGAMASARADRLQAAG